MCTTNKDLYPVATQMVTRNDGVSNEKRNEIVGKQLKVERNIILRQIMIITTLVKIPISQARRPLRIHHSLLVAINIYEK